jgi:hypothetical protein
MPASLRVTVAGQWRTLTAFPATTIQIGKQQEICLLGLVIIGPVAAQDWEAPLS